MINLPTELQFSLLSEEVKVLEEELIPFHRKKHTLLLKPPYRPRRQLLPVSRGWLSEKKHLAARLGEEFSLDTHFHM
jgi:hypothetical protein